MCSKIDILHIKSTTTPELQRLQKRDRELHLKIQSES